MLAVLLFNWNGGEAMASKELVALQLVLRARVGQLI